MSYEILNKSVVKPGGQKVVEKDIPRKSRIVYTNMPSDYVDISKIDNIVASTNYKGTFQYRNLETETGLITGTRYDIIIWTSTKDIFKLVTNNEMITIPTMKSSSKDRFSNILKNITYDGGEVSIYREYDRPSNRLPEYINVSFQPVNKEELYDRKMNNNKKHEQRDNDSQ